MSFVGSGGSWFGTIYADRRKKIIASESEVFRERIAATSGGNGEIDFRAYDVCIIAGGFDQAIVRKIGILGGEKLENYSQQLFETAVKISIVPPKPVISYQKFEKFQIYQLASYTTRLQP